VTMFTTAVSVRNVNAATPPNHSNKYDSPAGGNCSLKKA
jgi:hypothetical protein